MDNREQLQQQMLELIYGLLSDQESAELVERISSDGELARKYAELKERTELLAEVTKVQSNPPNFSEWKRQAGEHDKPTPKSVTGATWTARTLQVLSALAACLLVAALAYPKLTFNEQQQTVALQQQTQSLADDFLSLSITGPSLMATEVRNEFFVSVENAANQPVDAQVEYWFKSPANETVYYGLTEAKHGQVVCQIPADEVSSAAKLEVIAKRGDVQTELGLDVKAAPPKPVAILQTDREFPQPGETVNFRAVVLDPQNQQDRSANVNFLWSLQNNQALNPITTAERSTLRGVAQGQMKIPAVQSSENIELTIESPELQNNFQQRELPVLVERQATPAYATRSQNDAYGPGNRLGGKAPVQLAAKPEGGNLVAGVENRLYYSNQAMIPGAATPRTQVRSAGKLSHQQEEETAFGSFRFVPQPAEEYTIEVASDPEQPLEQQSFLAKKLPATLQVNNGVALANEPLEVDVRVAIPNTTMALVAGDDYATIGHNVWDVGVNAPITQPVKLNLPAEATGAQRVQLYSLKFDEATNTQQTPELIAERIIYRIPVHRFAVEVEGLPSQASPGEQLDLHLSVKDEYDNPAQATLGVQMERLPDLAPATQQPLGLEGEFLLNQRVVLPPTANTLPDDVRQLEQDQTYFDQVLALSDWRRQISPTTTDEMLALARPTAPDSPDPSSEMPVVRRSNRQSIQTKYQQALAVIQQQWQARMDDVRATSRWMLIGGGTILAVGLIGLALVQGRRKVAVWAPGLLVAFGSILWGMFSMSLSLNETFSPLNTSHEMVAVSEEAKNAQIAVAEKPAELADAISEKAADTSPPVTPMMVPAEASRSQMRPFESNNIRSINTPSLPQERNLYEGANSQPASDQPAAVVPNAASPRSMAAGGIAQASAKQQTTQPILWQPRLSTNTNGEVNLPVTLPQQPGRYRLVIDAHGSGRLGTVVRYVEVGSPAIVEPASPAND